VTSATGARRCYHRRSLCTCFSAAGARTGRYRRRGPGPCGASWLQRDVASEHWAGTMHWLEETLLSFSPVLVALRAPSAFSSCPPRLPPEHPCDPKSHSPANPPCGGFLCSWCVASTLAWCPCLQFSLDRYAPVKAPLRALSVAESKDGREAAQYRDG